jgi:hypothetical protein
MSLSQLSRTLNLDEYNEPKFTVLIRGIEHVAQVRTIKDLRDLENFEINMEKDGVQPGSRDSIEKTILYVFPTIQPAAIEGIHVFHLSALYNELRRFIAECYSATVKDLENFSKAGKANP